MKNKKTVARAVFVFFCKDSFLFLVLEGKTNLCAVLDHLLKCFKLVFDISSLSHHQKQYFYMICYKRRILANPLPRARE